MTLTVTLRGTPDGPWVVIHADSVDEVADQMNRLPALLADRLAGMDHACIHSDEETCWFCEQDESEFDHDAVQLACDEGTPPELGNHNGAVRDLWAGLG